MILVVDDDLDLVDVVRTALEREGFAVDDAGDGATALTKIASDTPELVVLDLGLPEVRGLDVLRQVRVDNAVPVIVLSGRSDEADRIIGLELGADDYVVKPFSPREVVLRVRAILRRVEGEVAASEVLQAGGIILDLAAHEATVAGRPVELTPMEFELLAVLVRSPGRTFARAQLLQQIQDSPLEGFDRTVDVHIRNIRAKIEPDPKNPRYILTVYGVGYKLTGDVDAA